MKNIAIYVGTYGKYNIGSLAGAWLNVNDYESEAEFYEACRELHKDEQDPEFMFQDFENMPDNMAGECYNLPNSRFNFFTFLRALSCLKSFTSERMCWRRRESKCLSACWRL